MSGFDNLELMFVLTAFLFQFVLIAYFAARKYAFDFAIRYGWIIYALSLPAAGVSLILLLGSMPLSLWLGGFLYLIWAIFGYAVEYALGIRWRNPVRWPIFIPYVALYLATVMFYWWPLGLVSRALWFVCTLLVIVSTILNIASHKRAPEDPQLT
jgi:hypothetical protein